MPATIIYWNGTVRQNSLNCIARCHAFHNMNGDMEAHVIRGVRYETQSLSEQRYTIFHALENCCMPGIYL